MFISTRKDRTKRNWLVFLSFQNVEGGEGEEKQTNKQTNNNNISTKNPHMTFLSVNTNITLIRAFCEINRFGMFEIIHSKLLQNSKIQAATFFTLASASSVRRYLPVTCICSVSGVMLCHIQTGFQGSYWFEWYSDPCLRDRILYSLFFW